MKRLQHGRRWLALAVFAPACWSVSAGNAKPPDPPTDAELLEFLGSLDSGPDAPATPGDGSWIDFLSHADLSKVAKTSDPNGSGAKQAVAGVRPPAPGVQKDE